MQEYIPAIQTDASLIARIDCLLSFAKTAAEHGYIRPAIDADNIVLDIHQGRHPVIETQLPVGESYVPNNIYLDDKKQQIIIITGPNMAGKSALLRQTALIVAAGPDRMLRAGREREDRSGGQDIHTCGASDNISLGESTFMVEMTEQPTSSTTLLRARLCSSTSSAEARPHTTE